MRYYINQFNDETITKYAIWYESDELGYVCEEGKILFFDSVELLEAFCDTKKITITTDEGKIPFVYDLGYLKNWLRSPDDNFECLDMLGFWDMISDALKSLGIAFLGDRKDDYYDNSIHDNLIHDKLFNIALNPGKTKYVHEWTKEEIDKLQKVLSQYKFFWS